MSIHFYARQGNLSEVASLLASGINIDAKEGYTGKTPLLCAALSPEAGVEMLKLLLENGANINAVDSEGHRTVLSSALRSGSVEKVKFLMAQGCDIHYQHPHGYDAAIDAMYSAPPLCDGQIQTGQRDTLIPFLNFLIEQGVALNGVSDYGESAVKIASRQGRFDALKLLLSAGADGEALWWDELLYAIPFGSIDEIEELIATGSDLFVRDHHSRTPWLLSLHVGDMEKAKLILASGALPDDEGHYGTTPLHYVVDSNNTESKLEIVQWLIELGCDVNCVDEFGMSPLMLAAQRGNVEVVKHLLASGANSSLVTRANESALNMASSLPVAKLLIAAGEPLKDINETVRSQLTGIGENILLATQQDYAKGRERHFGKNNPELMNFPFWQAMIRCRKTAYTARLAFNDTDDMSHPVWCYDRFGSTLTSLPDGRVVEIGGEHEDFYDPDFCIYNDVVVYQGNGKFKIFGYPKHVFPPTDFHTATLVDDVIYIIGNLGYKGDRQYGTTPVYRLCCDTFSIEPIKTTGAPPGWISRHQARYQAPSQIIISGGKLDDFRDGKAEYVDYSGVCRLDLTTFTWHHLTL